mmetsp:Transcript_75046/g.229631  ORF Transcript_75046/g.229631 Transcript_75046/m.229631 type:complete len:284 (-) Transcript_75046:28-879(-)
MAEVVLQLLPLEARGDVGHRQLAPVLRRRVENNLDLRPAEDAAVHRLRCGLGALRVPEAHLGGHAARRRDVAVNGREAVLVEEVLELLPIHVRRDVEDLELGLILRPRVHLEGDLMALQDGAAQRHRRLRQLGGGEAHDPRDGRGRLHVGVLDEAALVKVVLQLLPTHPLREARHNDLGAILGPGVGLDADRVAPQDAPGLLQGPLRRGRVDEADFAERRPRGGGVDPRPLEGRLGRRRSHCGPHGSRRPLALALRREAHLRRCETHHLEQNLEQKKAWANVS